MCSMRGARAIVVAIAFSAISSLTSFGCGFFRNGREVMSLQKVVKAEEAAFRVYRRGTGAEARAALVSLAQLLEAEAREWEGTPHGRVLAFDLALTYGRLGLLAERTAADSDSKRYLAFASAWYRKSGQRRRNEQELRQLVESADQAGDRGLATSSQSDTTRDGTRDAAQQ
jgi:hypothetical protein